MQHEQSQVTGILGGVYHTQLSEYAPDYFTDTRVTSLLKQFQKAICDSDAAIETTNSAEGKSWRSDPELKGQKYVDYHVLLHQNIPQSINI